ncbi:MAG: L,D-transpeptidase family protein [Polyangiaceae bacterium]|nr:L,D-transpeptidase family protein [Polyangiaceae bacterium]
MWRAALAVGGAVVACAATPEPASAPASAPLRAQPPEPGSRPATTQSPEPAVVAPTVVRDAFGEGYPRALLRAPGTGVGSLGWGTWIQPAPRAGALPLGSIRPGDSLALESTELLPGHGKCPRFARVAGGFVCAGPRATLDMQSRWMKAGVWTEPAPGVMPYHYALSVGAPMLTRPLPADKMLWKTGARDRPRMRGWNEGHDELAEDVPIEANGPMPEFLQNGGQVPTPWGEPKGVFFKMIPAGTMIAYTRAFEAFGETWVLSTDMSVVPARGLKRFRVSQFHGIELGNGVELPVAWIRKKPRPKWRKSATGFEQTGESWPAKVHVALTGNEDKQGTKRFLETREPGLFLERGDASVVSARPKPPWETKGTGKWIHVRVNSGTLTLYEGPKPVFTTLMSPGKEDATPYGRYFVESKHHFSTMATEHSSFWIADVPWTVYFKRPYAIHASYWHEDFGQRKSGGCVNLSPIDAKRVFDWIAPDLPAEWDTVQAYGMGGGTFVLVEG